MPDPIRYASYEDYCNDKPMREASESSSDVLPDGYEWVGKPWVAGQH